MKGCRKFFVVIPLLWAATAGAETISCPPTIISPPHVGTPEDVRRIPGWSAMWVPEEALLDGLDVYEDPPLIDLEPQIRGAYAALAEINQYAPGGRRSWVEGLETKTKTGVVVVFKTQFAPSHGPLSMICRYRTTPLTIYRELPPEITRCETYRAKGSNGRPVGPVIGECS